MIMIVIVRFSVLKCEFSIMKKVLFLNNHIVVHIEHPYLQNFYRSIKGYRCRN